MTHMLCQVVSYPPLEESDEHKVRNISSKIEYTSHPLIEYAMEDAPSYNEYID